MGLDFDALGSGHRLRMLTPEAASAQAASIPPMVVTSLLAAEHGDALPQFRGPLRRCPRLKHPAVLPPTSFDFWERPS